MEETAQKMMGMRREEGAGGGPRSSTTKLLSFSTPEDCYAMEREQLLGDLQSLQKVIEQKDAERVRLVKKTAETEKGLRQQNQSLRARVAKLEQENK